MKKVFRLNSVHSGFVAPLIVLTIFLIVAIAGPIFYFRMQIGKGISTLPQESPLPEIEAPKFLTYSNNKYSFDYPNILETKLKNNIVWVGEYITVYESRYSVTDCRGDCPLVESEENITIDSKPAKKFAAFNGAIGGSIPHNSLTAQVLNKGVYFKITVSEISNNMPYTKENAERKPGFIPQEQIEAFDKIISSFKFRE